jgi:hypothetical protein
MAVPGWDRFWLENISAGQAAPSFGLPEPYKIRVFSLLNSPGTAGTFLSAALLFVCSRPVRSALALSLPILASFLLTLNRTAWLGWLVSVLSLLLLSNTRPMKIVRYRCAVILVGVCLLVPLFAVEPWFGDVIAERFGTLTFTVPDESLTIRDEAYAQVLRRMSINPLGIGIEAELESGGIPLDGGPIAMLLAFGYPGTILFCSGFLIFMASQILLTRVDDQTAVVSRAAALGILAQFPSGNIFIGGMGMLLWTFLGLNVAASRFACLPSDFSSYARKSDRPLSYGSARTTAGGNA